MPTLAETNALAETLATAIADSLQLRLLPSELTDWEYQRAKVLQSDKYASEEWTAHR